MTRIFLTRKSALLMKAAACALAFILVVSGAMSVKSGAADKAGTEKYDPISFDLSVKDYSATVKGETVSLDVVAYYSQLKLPGKDKVSKKINKKLSALAKTYDPESVFNYAESQVAGIDEWYAEHGADETWTEMTNNVMYDPYYDYVTSWVQYNDGKYLSDVVMRNWYAGGVSNTFKTGYTFDLKTGKPAKITKVTGWSLKDIKERLIGNITADGESEGWDYEDHINGMKESDFSFYLKEGNVCVVTFDPYEVGYGGWYRQYEIEF